MRGLTLPSLLQNKWFLCVVAFLSGVVTAFSMAPYNFVVLLFVSLGGLYWILDKAKTSFQAALNGYFFGLGYFIFGLYWIGNALLVDGNPYRWVWPLAVLGLPALLSFFPATACYIIKKFFNMKRVWGYAGFVAVLSIFEWLRGHLFTGFPWNLYGHAWVDILPIVQVVSFSNVYFLTFLTVFWMSIFGFFAVGAEKRFVKAGLFFLAAGVFTSCYVYGKIRLDSAPMEENRDYAFVLVQPNIRQDEKWNADKILENFTKTLELSRNHGHGEEVDEKATYIIWPETAITYYLLDKPWAISMITDVLSEYPKAYLITGALRYDPDKDAYYNSSIMIDAKGNISNIYNKSHLVPFGEYIPFNNLFDIAPIVGFKGFDIGTGVQTFETAEGLRYSPVVCYEIIFSGHVVNKNDSPDADIIINVTNDGWYGISPGPYQHFAQAIFRAVEENTPVIRSANTGFSGMVDPYGRTLYKTSLFKDDTKKLLYPTR